MKDNKIQYKILKSEACGHTIEYKMVKKEHELEKARIDEGLSPREKMKAREARSSKEREPRELSPEQYETGKKIARTKAVTETGEKQRKQTLKDVLHTHKQNTPKTPSKEDLEYPMAASEKDCSCEDKAEKCECEDEGMKKREKFYIQKIQELRKQSQLDTLKGDLPTQITPRGMTLRGTPEQRQAAGVPNFIANPVTNNTDLIAPSGKGVLPSGPRSDQMSAINRFQENQNAAYNRPATTASFADTMRNITAPAAQVPAAQTSAAAAPTRSAIVGDSDFETSLANKRKEQGFPPENLSTMQTATPAAAPQRMQFGKDSGVSFKDAFAQARKSGNQEFDWYNPKTGKTQPYHTYSKEEFQQGKTLAAGRNPEGFQSQAIGADNKYFKGYQAQQKAPAAQAPAAQTKAQVTGMNPDGSISSSLPDGRKQLTMPENPMQMPRKDQIGTAPALNEPGKVGMKIPGASVKYSEAPGFKFEDTATTQAPTSEQAEGNLKYNKNNKLNSNMG